MVNSNINKRAWKLQGRCEGEISDLFLILNNFPAHLRPPRRIMASRVCCCLHWKRNPLSAFRVGTCSVGEAETSASCWCSTLVTTCHHRAFNYSWFIFVAKIPYTKLQFWRGKLLVWACWGFSRWENCSAPRTDKKKQLEQDLCFHLLFQILDPLLLLFYPSIASFNYPLPLVLHDLRASLLVCNYFTLYWKQLWKEPRI